MSTYLDYAAYYLPKPNVVNHFLQTLEYVANPSSMHFIGNRSNVILKKAKNLLIDICNCSFDDNVIFTSGATEANNMAFHGFNHYIEQYIIGSTEHSSISNLIKYKQHSTVMVKNGQIDLQELDRYLSNGKKSLVSIMMINNETGVITENLKEAIELTHKYGGIFHSDGAQAAIKMHINFNDLNLDMLSLSSAKVGAISGCGALIIKNQLLLSKKFNSLIKGAGHQDNLRAGTPAVALIDAFVYAIKIGIDNLKIENIRLKEALNIIQLSFGDFYIIGKNRNCCTLYISNNLMHQSEQVALFDQNQICVSAGAACAKGGGIYSDKFIMSQVAYNNKEKIECSDIHSYEFKKLKTIYESGIRVSVGNNTKPEDIDNFIDVYKQISEIS